MTFIELLVFAAIGWGSYLLGVWGWAQIVGSIQQFKLWRLFTIILWAAILFGGWYACQRWRNEDIIALYIGYALSLFHILRAGKIE